MNHAHKGVAMLFVSFGLCATAAQAQTIDNNLPDYASLLPQIKS